MNIAGGKGKSTLTFNMLGRDIEITLKRIIDSLVGDDEDKVRGLIQVLRLVDRTDDDAKCYVISTGIMLAYSVTMHHENSLKRYLTEIDQIGGENAPVESGPAEDAPAASPASEQTEDEGRDREQKALIELLLKDSTPTEAIKAARVKLHMLCLKEKDKN